ncbi:alpha/beta fold hydrolase [Humitalea sp. 24SJ18S-53]|uniref:alpha/beta fold hydrolase n=1 Tax=Humitalea sp. 24SJ18S-53 TaxID=3422307 RepID=UPI003D66804F
MTHITIDGARVAYTEAGAGPRAIVFVHGGFGSSSGLWASTMAALPPGWRGYAINNFVESDPPPDGYTIPAFAQRLDGFIAALGLPSAVICGHSMGGVVCQQTAITYPGRVAGLALVATGPSIRNHGIALQVLADLEAGGATRQNLDAISRHWFAHIPDQAQFDAYVDTATRAPLDGMLAAQRSLVATDLEPLLPRIACPTLVLHGARDHGRTMDHAERLLAGISGARLALFETSGHAPMWEAPAAFQAALAEFLARIGDAA